MKIAITAALIAVSQCTPVAAHDQECFPAAKAAQEIAAAGFEITFGDNSAEYPVFMAENGKGAWVMFVVSDKVLCPLAAGEMGIHVPKPPNT